MKRNIKKQLKKLKREKKKNQQSNKPFNKYWPAIWCVKEQMFIGVSYVNVKAKWKPKVTHQEWEEGNCKFRDDRYKIDMKQYKEGDLVFCPHCHGFLDFRIWLSTEKPEFYEVKNDTENNTNKLPNPQET